MEGGVGGWYKSLIATSWSTGAGVKAGICGGSLRGHSIWSPKWDHNVGVREVGSGEVYKATTSVCTSLSDVIMRDHHSLLRLMAFTSLLHFNLTPVSFIGKL